MPIDRELMKGSLDVLLLALLENGPMYGYQIVKEVRSRSEGLLDLKEGTLYPALHRLEKAGWIEGFWQARADGADRRYYRLTARGVAAAQQKRAEWRQLVAAMEGILR
ncbi:MAG: PadR family transcriptional regulator [Chloroflexaceae bacterium]|jgi:PadR family transcriptional regulator PadR|nr:PadR family transcriptional regulator [Chloroflexaceae bacterium]